VHLAYVFAMMYRYSLVPDDFSNYRGITLSPVISKLFEMVLLVQFEDQLSSDPLQFGFKRKSSCSHAIFAFKTTVDNYIKNGTTLSVCALDITKAFDILMDRLLPREFIGLLYDWFGKCFVCVCWCKAYSSWFQILAGVRQGGILSPVLFAVYMDPLIARLRSLGLGCRVLDEFFGCLFYADDILLMVHSNHSMQLILNVCDKFAEEFDMRFNGSKSVAMRVGNRYNENCAALQLAGKDIVYVSELKYLGICVSAAKLVQFSVEHLRLKFYRMFNCIYSKSKAANSKWSSLNL